LLFLKNLHPKYTIIRDIEEFYSEFQGLINFKITNTDFTTKIDKINLIKYINYHLTNEDVEIIFLNKLYYLEYLNFIKESKRWI